VRDIGDRGGVAARHTRHRGGSRQSGDVRSWAGVRRLVGPLQAVDPALRAGPRRPVPTGQRTGLARPALAAGRTSIAGDASPGIGVRQRVGGF